MDVDLSLTDNRGHQPRRAFAIRALWLIVESLTLLNPIVTSYSFKRWLLRRFGASIGRDVIIKPNVHVKFPWELEIGDNCWIGERSWIDNMVPVRLGDNVVVSQGAYLCTGNHDWADPGMGLVVAPITVQDGAWIGAFSRIAPGVTVGRQSVITLGSVLLHNAEPNGVYRGHPAALVTRREVRSRPGPPEPHEPI